MRTFVAAVFAASVAGAALAAPEPPAASPPNTVSALTVTAAPRAGPPKIVSTFPAAGQVIAAGALILHITFDQKMDQQGFAFAAGADGETPNCLTTPQLLNDGKTFVLLCTTTPGKSYALAINSTSPGGFANLQGTRAAPAHLAFSTSSEMGPRNLEDALKAAGLTPADGPIATQP